MTQQMIKALSDIELSQVIVWSQDEHRTRVALQKQETVARIKELARSVNIDITFAGKRGRPSKSRKE